MSLGRVFQKVEAAKENEQKPFTEEVYRNKNLSCLLVPVLRLVQLVGREAEDLRLADGA